MVRTAARKLMLRVSIHSSSETDRKPPVRGFTAPTLLTRMSSPPNSAIAASIKPSGCVRCGKVDLDWVDRGAGGEFGQCGSEFPGAGRDTDSLRSPEPR